MMMWPTPLEGRSHLPIKSGLPRYLRLSPMSACHRLPLSSIANNFVRRLDVLLAVTTADRSLMSEGPSTGGSTPVGSPVRFLFWKAPAIQSHVGQQRQQRHERDGHR
jgi:hypothetical protein